MATARNFKAFLINLETWKSIGQDTEIYN